VQNRCDLSEVHRQKTFVLLFFDAIEVVSTNREAVESSEEIFSDPSGKRNGDIRNQAFLEGVFVPGRGTE
jgi:hypothetical protein